VPGARQRLVSGLVGSITSFALVGLMGGVYPELGKSLGVDAALFGVLMAGSALGRSLVFLGAMRWSRWGRDVRVTAVVQLAAAAAVAAVSVAATVRACIPAFLVVGVSTGVCYYRGLYTMLETAGSRGRRSGVFEASILAGILLGSLGGGAMARYGGLHAPYVPAALFTVLMVLLQVALARSGRSAATESSRGGAGAAERERSQP
jgi:predicted MFS family arabinose efflux permease